jgi:hypothetical protein
MARNILIAAALCFGSLAVAGAATAQTRYVGGDGVNCRASASTSSQVIERFSRNEQVIVAEVTGGWARIERSPTCWIRQDLLSETFSFYSPPARSTPSPRRRSDGSSGRSARRGPYSDGSCPCSGSRVCIGPRGGRYCITSGGNKRYGV